MTAALVKYALREYDMSHEIAATEDRLPMTPDVKDTGKKRELEPWELAECAAAKAVFEAFNAGKPRSERITQEAAAARLGLSQGTFSNYLNGRLALNMTFAAGISRLFGAPVESFSPRLAAEIAALAGGASGEAKQEAAEEPFKMSNVIAWDAPEDLPDDQFIIIPRVEVTFSAGSGQMVLEEVHRDQGNAYRMDWVRRKRLNPHRLCDFILTGDSMWPSLPCGSKVTLNLDATNVVDGKVYGIRYGDQLRIKRLYKRFDGGLIIRSDNAAKYPEESLSPDQLEHVSVIGQYVAHSYDGDL